MNKSVVLLSLSAARVASCIRSPAWSGPLPVATCPDWFASQALHRRLRMRANKPEHGISRGKKVTGGVSPPIEHLLRFQSSPSCCRHIFPTVRAGRSNERA